MASSGRSGPRRRDDIRHRSTSAEAEHREMPTIIAVSATGEGSYAGISGVADAASV